MPSKDSRLHQPRHQLVGELLDLRLHGGECARQHRRHQPLAQAAMLVAVGGQRHPRRVAVHQLVHRHTAAGDQGVVGAQRRTHVAEARDRPALVRREPHRRAEIADGAVERVRIGERGVAVEVGGEGRLLRGHALLLRVERRFGRCGGLAAPGSSVATRPSACASTQRAAVGSMPVSSRASGALT
jgi:hypothetical protein